LPRDPHLRFKLRILGGDSHRKNAQFPFLTAIDSVALLTMSAAKA
jgi:hypothetical protein